MKIVTGVYFLHNLMDLGSLLEAILGTILNYMRDPYVPLLRVPLMRLILTVAHVRLRVSGLWF